MTSDMKKDRATLAGDYWIVVKAKYDNDIVDSIITPQKLVARVVGLTNESIVKGVVWIVAPHVERVNCGNG